MTKSDMWTLKCAYENCLSAWKFDNDYAETKKAVDDMLAVAYKDKSFAFLNRHGELGSIARYILTKAEGREGYLDDMLASHEDLRQAVGAGTVGYLCNMYTLLKECSSVVLFLADRGIHWEAHQYDIDRIKDYEGMVFNTDIPRLIMNGMILDWISACYGQDYVDVDKSVFFKHILEGYTDKVCLDIAQVGVYRITLFTYDNSSTHSIENQNIIGRAVNEHIKLCIRNLKTGQYLKFFSLSDVKKILNRALK